MSTLQEPQIIIQGRHLRGLSERLRAQIALGKIRRLKRDERNELLTLIGLARRFSKEERR
jgi:hypothetical protein